MKALKSNDKDDDQMWLTYWVIYAVFTVVESFADVALSWLPFYFFAKVGFLVFCFLPQTRGAKLVYEKVLEPLFSQTEGRIQTALKKSN
jgi:receptor expression-enhancing protein 5/6